MLVAVALVAAVFFLPQDFSTFKNSLERAAWFSSNRFFSGFGDYFSPANFEQPLLHTWSLAVEIQFYLLAPFIVLLLPVRWLKWIFTGLFIGFTILAEYRLRFMGIEQATYYSLYARLPEFFVGGLVALYTIKASTCGVRRIKWFGTLGVLLIALAAIAQPLFGPFPGIAALLPLAGSVLLLSQPSQGLVGRILCSKTLVWGGTLSYSLYLYLYLWHWPILAFLSYYSGAEVLGFWFSLLFIILTCVISIFSYYVIECAFRSKHANKKQILGWSLLAASVFGTSLTMVKINTELTPEQLPIAYLRYADPTVICHGKIVGDCLRGDLNSHKKILVLGDSHAAMLNYFFDDLGKSLSFKARVITASNCVTIPGFDYQRISEWAQKPCIDQIKNAEKYIEESDVIVIAGMWSYQTLSTQFNSSLKAFIQSWPNKHFLLLSQIPKLKKEPERVRRFNYIGLGNRQELDKEYITGNRQQAHLASELNNASFIKLDTLNIFNTVPVYNEDIIYLDSHHLNELGSHIYAEQARELFKHHLQ